MLRRIAARLCTDSAATPYTLMRKLPARYEPLLFSLLLSGLMSLLVSGVATWHSLGLPPDFIRIWASSWLSSWVVAFPAVLVVAPIVRRIVTRCVETR